MKKQYDYILVGAGLFNAVFAHQAKTHGKRCLVIDKRPHLGGNLYCDNIAGITTHRYGPHIFHTNNKKVWDYVNSLVEFNRFTLNTIANYKGSLYNLPFNMNTFYRMWGVTTPAEAISIIESQRSKFANLTPKNLEEQAISLVGQEIYEKLIKGYTEKQWGRSCKELPAFIIRRLPLRFTFNNNYFNDQFQGIPEGGYNRLIECLFNGIECKTSCNYFNDKSYFDSLAEKVVYSGCIDEYFGYRLGHLEYRSLSFETQVLPISDYQGNAIVNYTDASVPYTRIVEHKHFDINNVPAQQSSHTVITHEYPKEWDVGQEPFYPINDNKNNQLYQKYKLMAEQETNIIFGGRLAEYKYLNMDLVAYKSIKIAENEFYKL